ncbi:H-2 class II histocompatibility antigen, A-U alpha chain-like [Anabas testudineus]|uniref:Ig-like domain-containing protein n=1 Tax=Anabas testudineus TaxID=64144 RepID=A0A3Q1ITG8_ANATE|nr:H-2 class II histocompatibility antigen, A-U alpha chain-like [Anabas testudineus]
MNLSLLVLIIFTGAVHTSATSLSHNFHYTYGCYESGGVRVDVLLDDDVGGYADFSKGEVVWAMPHPSQYVKNFTKHAYEIAQAANAHCHSVLSKAKKADPDAPMRQESPSTFIYTRYEGEDGVFNTLFCLANYFYPPTINFTWTKNGVEVTEGVSNLRYHHNSDGTFHRISALTFTPREGDVFTCTVEHQASPQPLTRSWELEMKRSRATPAAVFLCVSLVFCLIGIGAGTYFFTKQPN